MSLGNYPLLFNSRWSIDGDLRQRWFPQSARRQTDFWHVRAQFGLLARAGLCRRIVLVNHRQVRAFLYDGVSRVVQDLIDLMLHAALAILHGVHIAGCLNDVVVVTAL